MISTRLRLTTAWMLAALVASMSLSAQDKQEKIDKASKRAKRAEEARDLPAVVWNGSIDPATLDIPDGIGGKEHAPDLSGTVTFLEEDMGESQPKFDVRDAQGVEWRVKLGEEARSETAATRLVWAAGYFVDEDYYVDDLKVDGLPKLRRGQQFESDGGVVHGARLERKSKDVKKLGTWSWSENPFVGTREFNGLRVMMALVNNWDSTTINNSIYEVNKQRRYVVTDLGASFGKTGDTISRSKDNMEDYVNSKFTDKTTNDSVDFVLHSRPFFLTVFDVPNYIHRSEVSEVTKHIPRADAKWMGQRLAQLSDEQIRDCFRSSGYSPDEVEGYSKAVQHRIAELNALKPGGEPVKLIIEPDDGVSPLISAIKNAKESVDLAIFRFDHSELYKALKAAVSRGVKVNALVASVNHGGEKSLRKLEMRFLDAGITVSRSASELIRYHDKIIVVDRRILYVLSFNFTRLDIDHSRGFGIVANNKKWVAEGLKLLEADTNRIPYTCSLDTFVVSPANARKALANFLKRAHKQLLIYDPKISDKEMIRILQNRAKAGVEIRVIGQTGVSLSVKKLAGHRLHTRTIIRDGRQAFIGSQSLRPAELDLRREVGLIIREAKTVKKLVDTFESDWSSASRKKLPSANKNKVANPKNETDKAAKALIQELHPIAKTVKKVVKKVVAQAGDEVLADGSVQDTVKLIVKKVMKTAVKEAVRA